MNELDQFVKHKLKVKYYERYADDFIFISDNQEYLKKLLPKIKLFLEDYLKLKLHPNKVSIRKLKQGIDFLGYITLPHYTALRNTTKKRMFKRINKTNESSYIGLLSHCDGYKLRQRVNEQLQIASIVTANKSMDK